MKRLQPSTLLLALFAFLVLGVLSGRAYALWLMPPVLASYGDEIMQPVGDEYPSRPFMCYDCGEYYGSCPEQARGDWYQTCRWSCTDDLYGSSMCVCHANTWACNAFKQK
jgi:hypothetical protein